MADSYWRFGSWPSFYRMDSRGPVCFDRTHLKALANIERAHSKGLQCFDRTHSKGLVLFEVVSGNRVLSVLRPLWYNQLIRQAGCIAFHWISWVKRVKKNWCLPLRWATGIPAYLWPGQLMKGAGRTEFNWINLKALWCLCAATETSADL